MHKSAWFLRWALILAIPAALCAQTPEFPLTEAEAPAETVQALKDRVDQFFQYHVGPVNRRAIDYVAEDTKDFYFASGKIEFLNVKLTNLTFSRDLQKAMANVEATRLMNVQQYSAEVTSPMMTTWKVEEGKWVFYTDKQEREGYLTPFGTSPPRNTAAGAAPALDGTLPKDFATPERLASQALAIMAQAGPDKEVVSFTFGKGGEEVVTFHNGVNGQVSLQLSGDPRLPGLKIVLDTPNLARAEDAHVRVTYDPAQGVSPGEYGVRLLLAPFNQEFPIRIRIAPPRN